MVLFVYAGISINWLFQIHCEYKTVMLDAKLELSDKLIDVNTNVCLRCKFKSIMIK